MEASTAFWESVVGIAPILALAAVVELRLTRWHKFRPLQRWMLGMVGGLVLFSLGYATAISLLVLQSWNAEASVNFWLQQFAYWATYLGVCGVILFPVLQLWQVVFADLKYWRAYNGVSSSARLGLKSEKELVKLMLSMRDQRKRISEEIYNVVIAKPESAFRPLVDGGYRLEITDTHLKELRFRASELDELMADAFKVLRKSRKKRRKLGKGYVQIAGSDSARVAKRLKKYQGVWK